MVSTIRDVEGVSALALMDYTMAHLDNLRDYSHCPPKKRPLAFYTQELDDEQPQDLSVKRRRHDSDDQQVPHTPAPLPSTRTPTPPTVPHQPIHAPVSPPRMPSLADFYLKLFQTTAVQQQQQQQADWWRGPMMWPLMQPASHPALAPHHHPLATHPALAARLASPQASEDRLASPRSTASEDSGVGTESLSEDEIDVISDADTTYRASPAPFDASSEESTQARGGESRYSCTECNKSYSTYSGLSKHKQFHCAALGAKSFGCKHCDKVYTSLGALKMHIRTHTLPCKCHLCGKAFSRPWLLQGHIRTHTGEKPFQCSQCDRCFADRSNLRAHLQTHAHVKKYACTTCHKTFSRMSLLNKHTEAACPARPQPQPAE